MKIAHYCICLESLFSTDKEGISNRVAERAARCIGMSGAEQQAVFKDVKALYAYRSAVLHGSPLDKKKDAAIREAAVKGDEYLRRILVRVIHTPELKHLFSSADHEELGAHFLNQMFPTS